MALSTPTTVSTHPAHPVRLRDVGRTFTTDVDLDIEAGEVIALIGASGLGQETTPRRHGATGLSDRSRSPFHSRWSGRYGRAAAVFDESFRTLNRYVTVRPPGRALAAPTPAGVQPRSTPMTSKTPRTVGGAVGTLALLVSLTACSSAQDDSADATSGSEDTTITVGFNPGPYQQQFEEGIAPILEEQGYTLESEEFTDGVQINVALSDGEIDANIMQHPVYLDFVNEQEGLQGEPLVQVPTPPMGVFGGAKSSLDDVADGDIVSLPNEPSNLYRALVMLQSIGWLELSDDIEPGTASLNDVTENPHSLELTLMDNAQQVRALPDVAYAAVQGNFAVSSGLELTDALQLEDLQDEFSVYVVVDQADLESSWATDLAAAYESAEFEEYISSHSEFDGYNVPE